nr:ATP-binding protein [Acanthopleuribacter pedis]
MVRQVVVNLCNNSALALKDGTGDIRFQLERGEHECFLRVADNGPGVAPDMVDHLFEPYRSSRAFGEGMGLGLAIARKIMLDHGGDLSLSRNTHGAEFTLMFPIEKPVFPTPSDTTEPL